MVKLDVWSEEAFGRAEEARLAIESDAEAVSLMPSTSTEWTDTLREVTEVLGDGDAKGSRDPGPCST